MNARAAPPFLARAVLQLLDQKGCVRDSGPFGVMQSISRDAPGPVGRALDFSFDEVGEIFLVSCGLAGNWREAKQAEAACHPNGPPPKQHSGIQISRDQSLGPP